jgi:hypothetical protein
LLGSFPQVLGDFMRILLEVTNCILSLNLGRNPELVYALLHKQEVFEQLRPHAGFAELVENLQVCGVRPGSYHLAAGGKLAVRSIFLNTTTSFKALLGSV